MSRNDLGMHCRLHLRKSQFKTVVEEEDEEDQKKKLEVEEVEEKVFKVRQTG